MKQTKEQEIEQAIESIKAKMNKWKRSSIWHYTIPINKIGYLREPLSILYEQGKAQALKQVLEKIIKLRFELTRQLGLFNSKELEAGDIRDLRHIIREYEEELKATLQEKTK